MGCAIAAENLVGEFLSGFENLAASFSIIRSILLNCIVVYRLYEFISFPYKWDEPPSLASSQRSKSTITRTHLPSKKAYINDFITRDGLGPSRENYCPCRCPNFPAGLPTEPVQCPPVKSPVKIGGLIQPNRALTERLELLAHNAQQCPQKRLKGLWGRLGALWGGFAPLQTGVGGLGEGQGEGGKGGGRRVEVGGRGKGGGDGQRCGMAV